MERRPLASLDAIVMGIFNSCKLDRGTNYAAEMMSKEGITSVGRAKGPTVEKVAERYPGPLLMTTMFSTQRDEQHFAALDMVCTGFTHQPEPYQCGLFMESRTYILKKWEMECGSVHYYKSLPDCCSTDAVRAHRCVGKMGGHSRPGRLGCHGMDPRSSKHT